MSSPGVPADGFRPGACAGIPAVSVPSELAAAVRKRVGARGLSNFVARALAHELEREGLAGLLDELEEKVGPPSQSELARARRTWPKR